MKIEAALRVAEEIDARLVPVDVSLRAR